MKYNHRLCAYRTIMIPLLYCKLNLTCAMKIESFLTLLKIAIRVSSFLIIFISITQYFK
jgi:hypothetical protein